jgi:Tfp pilus assembly protein PilV
METRTNQKKNCGFTLLETCIALVFLMIVLTGVIPLCVYAIKYDSAAAIRAGAVTVAQRKLEQLRASPFTSCTSSTEDVTVGPTTGSQTYTVEVTVTDTGVTLKNIKIVVTPQGRSTTGSVYAGNEGWMRGQVIIYTKRTTLGAGPNLG